MVQAETRQIVEYLQDHRGAMVDLLQRLALVESPSDVPAASARALQVLAIELERCGLRVDQLPGTVSGGMLHATPVESIAGRPYQMVVGHLDTVWPIGTLLAMPVYADETTVRGPGVFDMKGGLVQMVYALRAIHELRIALPADPNVVVNTDEEIGSVDSSPLIRQLAQQAARAFVLEPAYGRTGKLKTGRKAVGSFVITIKGKSAHAGLNPGEGVSAILELSHQIQRLFALNDPARGVTVNVGTIDGGLRPNVVAPEVRASVDVRAPTKFDAETVEAAIRGLRPVNPETTILVEGGFGAPPMEPLPRNQALWQVAQVQGRELGLELEQASVGGASDGNTTSQYTATLDGLGAVGDGAHATHEYVEISRLVERAALLVLLLRAPLTGDTQTEV